MCLKIGQLCPDPGEVLQNAFWSGVIHEAVVVEADAFKETDVVYRHLASMSSDDIAGNAELVSTVSILPFFFPWKMCQQ
jgi:hypothetical protein